MMEPSIPLGAWSLLEPEDRPGIGPDDRVKTTKSCGVWMGDLADGDMVVLPGGARGTVIETEEWADYETAVVAFDDFGEHELDTEILEVVE
jgi:hypothetical protein